MVYSQIYDGQQVATKLEQSDGIQDERKFIANLGPQQDWERSENGIISRGLAPGWGHTAKRQVIRSG